jgi:ABC-type sugar transport system permease subunit
MKVAGLTQGGSAPSRRFRFNRLWLLGYALALPAVGMIVLVVAYPTAFAVWMSFHRKLATRIAMPYVGLENYIKVLGGDLFWRSAGRSIMFTVPAIVLKLVVGFATALVLNENFPGRGLARAIVLIPWALPPITGVLTWKFLFHDSTNVLGTILSAVRILPPKTVIPWLGVPRYAMAAVIIVNVWRGFPFFAITLLAGLAPIPDELYDASKVDGANVLQRFRHVTIPGAAPALMISTTLSTIWTLNEFTTIWLLTQGGPGDGTKTLPLTTYWEALGRSPFNMSQGVIYSLGMLPIMFVLIYVLSRGIASREEVA